MLAPAALLSPQDGMAIVLERVASNPLILRLLGLVALLLWFAALFAPMRLELAGPFYNVDFQPFLGWRLASYGWLGPLGLAPGWYANIPLAISLIQCLRGRPPGRRLAWVGLAVAATALAPFWYFGFAGSFRSWYVVRGPALWLWLSAFVLVWLPAIWRAPMPDRDRRWNRWFIPNRSRSDAS
jgi:hypothetical protein